MYRYILSDHDRTTISTLLDEIVRQYRTVEDQDFLRNAPIYAHELPRRLRQFLADFKLMEVAGVCLVSGYPIDDMKIGRTPSHWNIKAAVSPALHEEIFFTLCAALLGDVFGWSTQQDGYTLHEVLPIKEHENEQIGSGSLQKLWWHTEDAFHPYKGDYVALMCMRNPDRVATTLACVDQLTIDQRHLQILSEPRFTIRPDESHLEKNRSGSSHQNATVARLVEAAYRRINQMNTCPRKVPVLFGEIASPYLCLDPYFMDLEALDPEAREALQALIDEIDARLYDIVLQPGDCCFIDNLRAVHGRNPFKARYDGSDRWLKRLNITRDLRKSRDARESCGSRLIY